MTWCLIILFGGQAVWLSGYASKEECESSGTHAQRRAVGVKVQGWVCVPERTEPSR